MKMRDRTTVVLCKKRLKIFEINVESALKEIFLMQYFSKVQNEVRFDESFNAYNRQYLKFTNMQKERSNIYLP